MKDGWYYIKTWKRMEEEYGLDYIGDIDTEMSFPKGMEEDMPPHRAIYIEDDRWVRDRGSWSISEDMIESPCYEIGKEYEFSNDGVTWERERFAGYVYEREHTKYQSDYPDEYPYIREIKELEIEITCKINGKECKLSDISEETLKKIRENS